MIHDAWTDVFENGKHLVPDSSTEEARVSVGRIDAVGNVVARNMGLHVGPSGVKEGSNPFAAPRRQDREAGNAGAPH